MEEGHLAQHFGHCERLALVDVDPTSRLVTASTEVEAPEHQPGLLPPWLKQRGVTLVISGGMGSRARNLFEDVSIEVITGAPAENSATIVRQYLDRTLVTGRSDCTH